VLIEQLSLLNLVLQSNSNISDMSFEA